MKRDTYEQITEQVIAALEEGTVPWRKPWATHGPPRNLQSSRPYRGINAFLLGLTPHSSPFWTTYRAAKKAGGHVRKGEHGRIVVFWKWLDGERDETTSEVRRFPMARAYRVFNAEQCEGLELPTLPDLERREHSPLEAAERIIAGMPNPPTIEHGGEAAYYMPGPDHVQLPEPERFDTGANYYATAYHELGHATGHASRLDRAEVSGGAHRFGSADYSREELVAEMSSAFLCGEAGIAPVVLSNSAAYIANWLKRLRDDARLVVTAAQRAQKAADYILGEGD